MVRLVDDLLDFSRMELGRLQLQRRQVNVSEVLGHLVESFRHQPGGERIRSELPEGSEAFEDPERLNQIVSNLLSNALRYAEDGEIVIKAARRNGDLRVDVTDCGAGIPLEEQSRVWDTFYRGSKALNSQNRGSGLGLAVVKHLVELHGGRVGLKSAPGEGTTFWFKLPAEAETTQ